MAMARTTILEVELAIGSSTAPDEQAALVIRHHVVPSGLLKELLAAILRLSVAHSCRLRTTSALLCPKPCSFGQGAPRCCPQAWLAHDRSRSAMTKPNPQVRDP